MVIARQANHRLNLSLHVLILFIFLTIFFFAYISHLEQKKVNDSLTSAIDGQVNTLLNAASIYAEKADVVVNWETIKDISVKIQKDANNQLPEVRENHKRLLYVGLGIIGFLVIVFLSLIVYYHMKRTKVELKKIVIENAITFSIIGLIEYLFFTKIASKYVPITPDLLSSTILERIKYKLNEYIANQK